MSSSEDLTGYTNMEWSPDPPHQDTDHPPRDTHNATDGKERVWRYGEISMTYNEWLAKEKELDNIFLVWKRTEEGQREVEAVYNRFPGLPRKTMESEDVQWFVREMSTPGTYLRQLFDFARHEVKHFSCFTPAQVMVLALLTMEKRSILRCEIMERFSDLFPVFKNMDEEELENYQGYEGEDATYDHLFPRHGYIEGNTAGVERLGDWGSKGTPSWKYWNIIRWYQTVYRQYRPGVLPRAIPDPFRYSYTLPPGEENLILTDRYESNRPLYYDTPGYIEESRLHPGEVAKGWMDLNDDLRKKIFKQVALFEGPLLVAMRGFEPYVHQEEGFHCRVLLPNKRLAIKREPFDLNLEAEVFGGIPDLLALRTVCKSWNAGIIKAFSQNTFVFRHCPGPPAPLDTIVVSKEIPEDYHDRVKLIADITIAEADMTPEEILQAAMRAPRWFEEPTNQVLYAWEDVFSNLGDTFPFKDDQGQPAGKTFRLWCEFGHRPLIDDLHPSSILEIVRRLHQQKFHQQHDQEEVRQELNKLRRRRLFLQEVKKRWQSGDTPT